MSKIRVEIVDDDGLIRDGLKAILESHADMDVVGTAAKGDEGVALCKELKPDVVLMDIRMPGLDGVAATQQIKKELPKVKIIILTTFDDHHYIRSAITLGAEGFILKSSPAEVIVESIRAVHRGTTVLQADVARSLSSMLAGEGSLSRAEPSTNATGGNNPPQEGLRKLGLSPRETEVLTLIAQGLSNKEIAARLNLSDGTIRNYISEMLVKVDVRDRTQLAILYYKSLA